MAEIVSCMPSGKESVREDEDTGLFQETDSDVQIRWADVGQVVRIKLPDIIRGETDESALWERHNFEKGDGLGIMADPWSTWEGQIGFKERIDGGGQVNLSEGRDRDVKDTSGFIKVNGVGARLSNGTRITVAGWEC